MSRKWTDDQLKNVLNQDPLAEAELITGESYKQNKATGYLGLELALRHGDAKQRLLKDAGDSHRGSNLSEYHVIIRRMGFEQVASVPFQGENYADDFQIWWEPRRGLLLAFDTYRSKQQVNGGHVYYQWRPNEGCSRFDLTSSGTFTKDGIWTGDHDCREAICFKMRRLEQNGTFIVPWTSKQRVWLCHYADLIRDTNRWRENDEIIKRVTAERIAMLPLEVREAICEGPVPRSLIPPQP